MVTTKCLQLVHSNGNFLKLFLCMMIVGNVNALQLFGQLVWKLLTHPGVTSLMKGTYSHALYFLFNPTDFEERAT